MNESYYNTRRRTLAPDVLDVLIPAAEAMVDVVRAEKNKSQLGDLSENREYRKAKARCVHRIATFNQEYNVIATLDRKVKCMQDGTFRCELCKAKLLPKLDESAKRKLQEAIEVIDTIVAFGPDLGLINIDPAHPDERPIIESMLDVKQFFALHMIPLTETMVKTMAMEESYSDNDKNFTSEYLDKTKKPTAIF